MGFSPDQLGKVLGQTPQPTETPVPQKRSFSPDALGKVVNPQRQQAEVKPEDYRPSAEELRAAGADPAFAGVPGGKPEPARNTPPSWVNKSVFPEETLPGTLERAGRGAVYNVPTEVLKTGAALTEGAGKLSGSVGGPEFGEGLSERMQTAYPSDVPEGAVEGIVQTTLESLPGIAAGGALGRAVFQSVSATAPLWQRSLKALTAATLGDSMAGFFTMNPDERKVFMGKDSMFRTGWGYNEDTGELNQDIFAKKLNLAMDEMLAAGGANAMISGVLGIIKHVPVKMATSGAKVFSKGSQEKEVVSQFLDIIGDIDPNDPPKVAYQKRQAARNIVANNKEVFHDLSRIDPSLSGDKNFRSTIGILTKNLRDKAETLRGQEKQQLLQQITRLEEVASANKGAGMEARLDAPTVVASDMFEDASRTLTPTPEDVQRGGDQMVESLQKQIVEPAQSGVDRAFRQGVDAKRKVADAIQNDPLFQETLPGITGMDTKDIVIGKTEEITNTLLDRAKTVLDKKKELYSKIPEEARYGNTEHVLTVLQEKGITDPAIIKAVEETGGDIIKMDELASFRLNRMIDAAAPSAKEDLIAVKKALTEDQLNMLANKTKNFKGGKQKGALSSIKEARDYYKQEVAPWRNSQTLDDIMSTLGTYPERRLELAKPAVTKAGKQTYIPEGAGLPYGIRDIQEQLQKAAAEGDVNPELVREWGSLNIQERLQNMMEVEGAITPEKVPDLINTVRANRELIGEEAANRLEQTLVKVRDGNINTADAEAAMSLAMDNLKSAQKKLYDNILVDYFNGKGLAKVNSVEGLDRLFRASDSSSENMVDIINRVGDNPVVSKALKGSYFKHLNQRLNDSPDKLLKDFTDPESPTASVVKAMYGEEGYGILQRVFDEVKTNQLLRAAKQRQEFSPSQIQTLGTKGINAIQTWFFGVLNPKAARIKTISNQLITDANSPTYVKGVLDRILSDPDEFLKVADEVLKKGPEKAPMFKKWVRRALTTGVIYGKDNDSEDFLNENQPLKYPIDQEMEDIQQEGGAQ